MLSRSKLALSAFALLASGGVMVAGGAGPDDLNKRGGSGNNRPDTDSSLNLRISIGDRDRGRQDHARPVSRVEQAPRSLDIQAFQAGDTVMILARGENTTAGFVTSLERDEDRRRDGQASIHLRNYGPAYANHGRAHAQVCTPFNVSGTFETRERLSEVHVYVAGQDCRIPVQRIDQMRRAH